MILFHQTDPAMEEGVKVVERKPGQPTPKGTEVVSPWIDSTGARRLHFTLDPNQTDWDALPSGTVLEVIIERSDDGGATAKPDTRWTLPTKARTGKTNSLNCSLEIPLLRVDLPRNPDGTNQTAPDGTIMMNYVRINSLFRSRVTPPNRDVEIGVTAKLIIDD